MTVVLSYDPETTVTKGFLGCHMAANIPQTQSHSSQLLLKELRDARKYAAHPLLLICLVYSFWIKAWKRELIRCRAEITKVQKMLGHMDEVVGYEEIPSIPIPNYQYAHERLVITHSNLNSSLGSFVAEFGADLAKMFDHLNRIQTKAQRHRLARENASLMDFFHQREHMAKCEDRHKARLLARMDMQLKVVSVR